MKAKRLNETTMTSFQTMKSPKITKILLTMEELVKAILQRSVFYNF